jgi:hypothetical protein
MSEIDLASDQIRQNKADIFAAALPKPPAGWTADKDEA